MRDILDFEFFQDAALDFGLSRDRGMFWMGTGLGKTAVGLTLHSVRAQNLDVTCSLVAAPKRVARVSWPDEMKEWAHTKNLTYTVIQGKEDDLVRQVKERTDFHFCTRDRLHWLATHLGEKHPYDQFLIDEASNYRNYKSNRWRGAAWFALKCKYVYEFTGTPAPNGYQQIWAQAALIDFGKRLGSTYEAFEERYFNKDLYSHRVTPRANAENNIENLIRDICFTLKKEDYLKLPPIETIPVWVELTEKEQERYDRLEKESVLQILEGGEILALNEAALRQKLLQYSNGAVYDEDKQWHSFHDQKIEALKDISEDLFGENLFVVYRYKPDLARIKAAFPHARLIDSDESIKDWNDGKISMGLAHPQSVGYGMNLQQGGHVVVWFGLTDDLEQYLQTRDRLQRKGQLFPVKELIILTKRTFDEQMSRTIPMKNRRHINLMDAMSSCINKYRRSLY